VILKDSNHALKIVGELKVPWIGELQIKRWIADARLLREILARPIKYMKDMGQYMDFSARIKRRYSYDKSRTIMAYGGLNILL
jgi:hypothetical protein